MCIPDCHSYVSVIDCWAKTKGQGTADKATDILLWMERNGLEPNAVCYNNVFQAWANVTSPDSTIGRFKEVWARMFPERDGISYCCKINVHARTCCFEDVCLAENHQRQFVDNDRLLGVIWRFY
jgi:hypothetical protein